MSETDAWHHIRQQRLDLIRYLETLDDDQWDCQSLCEGWRVRDVLAHLILEYHYSPRSSWWAFIKSGFRLNVFLRDTAIQLGNHPTSELLARFRSMIDEQQKPANVSVLNVLADLLVHEQDIRRALGHEKAMPLDHLRLIFEHWQPGHYNLGEKITGVAGRVKGIRFIITDLDIAFSEGRKVTGKAEDILMMITGRDDT